MGSMFKVIVPPFQREHLLPALVEFADVPLLLVFYERPLVYIFCFLCTFFFFFLELPFPLPPFFPRPRVGVSMDTPDAYLGVTDRTPRGKPPGAPGSRFRYVTERAPNKMEVRVDEYTRGVGELFSPTRQEFGGRFISSNTRISNASP